MKYTLKYGDVISNGMGRAMFLYYVWTYGGPAGMTRPGQRVVILTDDSAKPFFSLRQGQVLTVNWLELDGSEPDDLRVES